MAREKGSVRIGPVSVFSLVVIVSLAVLAVLSAATAHASYTEAHAQADSIGSAYANDAAAAEALADIDAALTGLPDSTLVADSDSWDAAASDYGDSADVVDSAMQRVASVLPQGDVGGGVMARSAIDGRTVTMTFSGHDGRTLLVALDVRDDSTYELEQWKVTTEWDQEPEEIRLWQGA